MGEVLIPDLVVINGLVNPLSDFNVTIRNLSDHNIQLSSGQTILKAVCCFNEKEISTLLLLLFSGRDSIDFFQRWDVAITKRDEFEGQRSNSPSDHQEVKIVICYIVFLSKEINR